MRSPGWCQRAPAEPELFGRRPFLPSVDGAAVSPLSGIIRRDAVFLFYGVRLNFGVAGRMFTSISR